MCPAAQIWQRFKSPARRHSGSIPTLLGNISERYLLPLCDICWLLIDDLTDCCIYHLHIFHCVDIFNQSLTDVIGLASLSLFCDLTGREISGFARSRDSAAPAAEHGVCLLAQESCLSLFIASFLCHNCFLTFIWIRLKMGRLVFYSPSHLPLKKPQPSNEGFSEDSSPGWKTS